MDDLNKLKKAILDQNKQEINYISALCGAGKTYTLCQNIRDNNRNKRTIIAVPSIDLANQYKDTLKELFINEDYRYHIITSDTSTINGPISSSYEHIKHMGLGDVLVITHACFDGINIMPIKKGNFDLYIDEIIPVYNEVNINISDNYKMITDYITHQSNQIDNTYILTPVDNCSDKLKSYIQNKNADEINALLTNLTNIICDDKITTYVDSNEYDKLIKGEYNNSIAFIGIREPSYFEGWNSTTVMSANFESSEMYKSWSNHVNFIDVTPSQINTPYHMNGRGIEITYFSEGNISKSNIDKNNIVIQNFLNVIGSSNDKYLAVFNKDNNFNLNTNIHTISVINHGMNSYQDYTHMLFLAAFNPAPMVSNLYATLGIDIDTLREARIKQYAYQFFLRGSKRDKTNQGNAYWYVSDKPTADYISALFPNSLVKKTDIDYKSTSISVDAMDVYKEKDRLTKNVKNLNEKYSNEPLYYTRINNKFAYLKEMYLLPIYEPDDICNDILSYTSKGNVSIYENAFIPACFPSKEVSGVERLTDYNKKCHMYSMGIILDYDATKIEDRDETSLPSATPNIIHKVFPNIKFVWYHTKTQGRWRAYIPTDKIFNWEVNKLIASYVIGKLNDYCDAYHLEAVFDTAFQRGTQLAVLPNDCPKGGIIEGNIMKVNQLINDSSSIIRQKIYNDKLRTKRIEQLELKRKNTPITITKRFKKSQAINICDKFNNNPSYTAVYGLVAALVYCNFASRYDMETFIIEHCRDYFYGYDNAEGHQTNLQKCFDKLV